MSTPHLILVYGCYASGKSSLLDTIASTYIDLPAPVHTFDTFNKELYVFDIPEYHEHMKAIIDRNMGRIPPQDDIYTASLLFQQFNDIALERMKQAISNSINQKKNLVIEVISIPPYIQTMVEQAIQKGYKVHCVYTKVTDVSTVIQRVYDRWLRTSKFPTSVDKIMTMFRKVNSHWDEFIAMFQSNLYTILVIDTTNYIDIRLEYLYNKGKKSCNVYGIDLNPCILQAYHL